MSGLQRIKSPLQLRQFTALWLQLQQIHLQPEIDDSICWNLTTSKVYSASSAYRSQFLGSYSTSRFDKLWRCKVECKCRLFMWLWLCGRILTNDNLAIKGIPHSEFYHLCNQEDGTPFSIWSWDAPSRDPFGCWLPTGLTALLSLTTLRTQPPLKLDGTTWHALWIQSLSPLPYTPAGIYEGTESQGIPDAPPSWAGGSSSDQARYFSTGAFHTFDVGHWKYPRTRTRTRTRLKLSFLVFLFPYSVTPSCCNL